MRQMYIQKTKKSLVAVFLILLVLLSAGCGKVDDSSDTADGSQSGAESSSTEYEAQPAGAENMEDIQAAKDDYVITYAEERIYKENNNNAGSYTDGIILASDVEHEIYYLTYKCQWYTGQYFLPADVYAVINIDDFYRNADNELKANITKFKFIIDTSGNGPDELLPLSLGWETYDTSYLRDLGNDSHDQEYNEESAQIAGVYNTDAEVELTGFVSKTWQDFPTWCLGLMHSIDVYDEGGTQADTITTNQIFFFDEDTLNGKGFDEYSDGVTMVTVRGTLVNYRDGGEIFITNPTIVE